MSAVRAMFSAGSVAEADRSVLTYYDGATSGRTALSAAALGVADGRPAA